MSDMSEQQTQRVWRAVSDAHRRALIDALAEGPKTTGQLVASLPELCRTAVMKHLAVLEDAGLVRARREGRRRWNYLNPEPLQRVCGGWLAGHAARMRSALRRLKDLVEGESGAGESKPNLQERSRK